MVYIYVYILLEIIIVYDLLELDICILSSGYEGAIRSVWATRVLPIYCIPYSIGGQLELLRVSQPSTTS